MIELIIFYFIFICKLIIFYFIIIIIIM